MSAPTRRSAKASSRTSRTREAAKAVARAEFTDAAAGGASVLQLFNGGRRHWVAKNGKAEESRRACRDRDRW